MTFRVGVVDAGTAQLTIRTGPVHDTGIVGGPYRSARRTAGWAVVDRLILVARARIGVTPLHEHRPGLLPKLGTTRLKPHMKVIWIVRPSIGMAVLGLAGLVNGRRLSPWRSAICFCRRS